jgi:hypothetical protein
VGGTHRVLAVFFFDSLSFFPRRGQNCFGFPFGLGLDGGDLCLTRRLNRFEEGC